MGQVRLGLDRLGLNETSWVRVGQVRFEWDKFS